MRYPRWNDGPAMGGEYLTEAGAHVLAERIRDAWAKAGHNIAAVVVQVGTVKREGKPIYGVQMPALVNGLPR